MKSELQERRLKLSLDLAECLVGFMEHCELDDPLLLPAARSLARRIEEEATK